MTHSNLMTQTAAAESLGISRKTIYRYMRDGLVKTHPPRSRVDIEEVQRVWEKPIKVASKDPGRTRARPSKLEEGWTLVDDARKRLARLPKDGQPDWADPDSISAVIRRLKRYGATIPCGVAQLGERRLKASIRSCLWLKRYRGKIYFATARSICELVDSKQDAIQLASVAVKDNLFPSDLRAMMRDEGRVIYDDEPGPSHAISYNRLLDAACWSEGGADFVEKVDPSTAAWLVDQVKPLEKVIALLKEKASS